MSPFSPQDRDEGTDRSDRSEDDERQAEDVKEGDGEGTPVGPNRPWAILEQVEEECREVGDVAQQLMSGSERVVPRNAEATERNGNPANDDGHRCANGRGDRRQLAADLPLPRSEHGADGGHRDEAEGGRLEIAERAAR